MYSIAKVSFLTVCCENRGLGDGLDGLDQLPRIAKSIATPAGVSSDINAKPAKALAETMKSKEVLATLKRQGFVPLSGPPDQFARYIKDDIKKWSAVAAAAGLRH